MQGFAEALQSEMAGTDQSEEVGESGQEEEEKGKKEDEQEKSDSV